MKIFVVYFEIRDYDPHAPVFKKAFRTRAEAKAYYQEQIQHPNVTEDYDLIQDNDELRDKYFQAQYIVQIDEVELV